MEENGFNPGYESYSEEEFAADEAFQKWVLMPDEDNDHFWNSFLTQYPDQQIAVENARKLVKHLAITGFHIPFLTALEKQSIKSSIFDVIGHEEPLVIKTSKRKWWWAAAMPLGVAAYLLLLTAEKTPHSQTVQTNTEMREVKEVLLPDGSVIVLNGNSSVKYEEPFKPGAREVYLNGNGYFKVKKQYGQPFIVHTPQLAVTVTGTEFNVNARASVTNVVLTEGSVDISLSKNEGVQKIGSLSPGDRIKYNSANRELVKEKVVVDLYTYAWDQQEWHFDNTPFETVIELMFQFYGTEVVLNNQNLKNSTISAIVSVKDHSNLIKVIERTLNVSITENHGQIFIN